VPVVFISGGKKCGGMYDIEKASKQFSEFTSKSNEAHSDAPEPILRKKLKDDSL
jgi:hypothetical protein